MDLSRRPSNNQSVATELTLRSIAFLRSSYWRLSALSRRFHCVHCGFTPSYKRARDTVTSQRTPYISMETPQRSYSDLCASPRSSCGVVGDLTALLWWPYGDRTALLSERRATVYFVHAQSARRRSAFYAILTGDASVLLRRCMRSYCAHLCILKFSWTPWDRRENAALVWQGF